MNVTLSVIIVLYNEFDMVRKCLKTVYQQKNKFMEVILVDNSDKIGVNLVLKEFPELVYIKNKTNLGFGKAVNVGLTKAKGEFSLILTPDTRLLSNTIEKTITFIQKNPSVALVGCRVYSYPRIFHLSACKQYPNLVSHLFEYNIPLYKLCKLINPTYHPLYYSEKEHEHILYPKHIIGAYMLFRTNVVKEIGFFDTNFRMYREETDLCRRLLQKGWKIVYLPVGGLVHYGGSEWKKTKISQALPSYMESTYTFFSKYHGKSYVIFAWTLGLLSAAMSIPYLFLVSKTKAMLRMTSQSAQLLPDWVFIFHWHLQNCNKVFSL